MIKTTVSYSTISEDELLAKIVPLYQIDHPATCRFWHRGGDDIYQVHSRDHLYSLRVYRHGVHSRDDVDFEIAALNYLKARGAKVSYPIARREGGYVCEITAPEGLRYVVLTTHAKGMEPGYCGGKDKIETDARLFGESVAELHAHSEGFESIHKRHRLDIAYLYHDSVEVIRRYLLDSVLVTDSERQISLDMLNKVTPAVDASLNTVQISELDTGFCHGDCHGSNVHHDNGRLTQFDFEDCGIGFRVYDIATFKWAIHGEDNENILWPAFLTGYQSVRQPATEDLKAIPVFVAIRHLWWIAFIIRNLPDCGYDDAQGYFIHRQLSRTQDMLSASQ